MDKLQLIKDKINEIQAKSAVASDMKAFVQLVLTFANNNKEEMQNLSKENLQVIKDSIALIEENNVKWANTQDTKSNALQSQMEGSVNEIKALLAKVKLLKPKDGETPQKGTDYFTETDKKEMCDMVMKEIPTVEPFILEGEIIVDKINELNLDKENQIDFKHIKNAPEFKNGNFYGGSGIKELVAGTNITIDNTNLGYPVITATGEGTGDVSGPATHAASYIPQWNATPNSKTLVEGVAMPAGGLAGLTALGDKVDKVAGSRLITTAEGTILGNTSNTNTGDNATNTQYSGLAASKQDALTFGIADTNKVQINAADVAVNDYALFTATGLKGRSYAEVLSDIGAQASLGFTAENVANKSTSVTTDGASDTKYPSVKAIKDYADQLIGAANAVVYKGAVDCSTNPNYPAADAGWIYIVSVAGKIGGASGIAVEVGDMYICNTDGTSAGDQATVGTYWNVIQKNIADYVIGPASVTDATIPLFDGVTGKLLKGSAYTPASFDAAGAAAAVTPTTLGLVIGTNVQAYNSNLTAINQALTTTSSPSFTTVTANLTGNASGSAATVTGAAQTAITSLGTLTALQVDNLNLNGNIISSTDTNGNITLTPNGTGYTILDGNVGIGTTAPASLLHIKSITAPYLTISGTSSGDSNGNLAINDIAGLVNFYSNDPSTTSTGGIGSISVRAETAFDTSYTPSYMAFYTHATTANDGTVLGNTTEQMRITSNGNVGIGTTAPQTKLALSSGSAISFEASAGVTDIALTHSADTLTLSGGNLALGANSLTMTGSIGATGARATKLWATDVESTNAYTQGGVAVPTISSTNTLTNKRITPRDDSTTSHATPTINTDNVDIYRLTAQAEAITSFTTNLSGTPTEGQKLIIKITGTAARAITWGTSFEASTVALPTTTVTTAMLTVGFIWNSVTSKFTCVAVA